YSVAALRFVLYTLLDALPILRVRTARADREQIVLGLDDVARARKQERLLRVGHDQQRLEAAQHAVRAPVLRELDRGARQRAVLLDRKSTRLNSSHVNNSYAVF